MSPSIKAFLMAARASLPRTKSYTRSVGWEAYLDLGLTGLSSRGDALVERVSGVLALAEPFRGKPRGLYEPAQSLQRRLSTMERRVREPDLSLCVDLESDC